jgi:hypothetical protein
LHTLFSLESTIAHSLSGPRRDEARPEWNGKSYEKDFDPHFAAHLDRHGFSGERVEGAGGDTSSVDAKLQVEIELLSGFEIPRRRARFPDTSTDLRVSCS